MKKLDIKNLIALAALATLAGGIEQAQAYPSNNWTFVGPSAGGGYIIIGSGALDEGPLSVSSLPTSLSPNGFNVVTLNAGSTASTSSLDDVIEFDTNGNLLLNHGTINGNVEEGVGVFGNANTVTNSGTINALDYAVDMEGNNNILNNSGLLNTGFDTVYISGTGNTINNTGQIISTGSWGIYSDAVNTTINNMNTISGNTYGIYLHSGANVTINNAAGATISGGDTALYMDTFNSTVNNLGSINGQYISLDIESDHNTVNNQGSIISMLAGLKENSSFNTINNHGVISGSSELGVINSGNYNLLNNWGTITSSKNTGVMNEGTFNTYNNWGTIYGRQQGFDLQGSSSVLNNWGTINSVGHGIYLSEDYDVINNYGTINAANYGIDIYDSHNIINNYGTISSSAGNAAAVFFEYDYSADTLNNWGMITSNGNPIAIYVFGTDHILNLNGHSSVIGAINVGSVSGAGVVVNLNFTGLSPANIAALTSQLIPQGVNSGNRVDVTFSLRGVNYVIDPAVVNANLKSYQLQAKTPDQASVGASLDSLTANPAPGTPLFNLLNAIDQSGNVPGALDALSPVKYSIYGDLAIQNTTALVQGVDRRLNNLRDGSESVDTTGVGGDNTVATLASGYSKDGDSSKESKQVVAPEPAQNRWGFFASGDGLFFRGGQGTGLQDGKANTVGTLAGVDGKVGDHGVIGALFAYNNADVTLDNIGSHATIESYSGGIYSSYSQDGFYANGLAAYTRNNYTSQRSIVFPGFASAANGSTHGDQYSANLDGGYDWNVTNRLTLGPITGVQYVHLDVKSFDETGGAGAAGLAVGDQSMDSLQSRVGARADYHLATTTASSVGAELYAAWQHEYLDDSRGISASFESGGLTPFSVQTGSPRRDAGVVGAALNFSFHNRLTLFADYELQMWNQSNFNQSINGGAKISW